MKKFLHIAIALILIAGFFAGCSNNSSNENTNMKNPSSQKNSNEGTKANNGKKENNGDKEKKPDTVTLKLFHGKQEAQETFNEIIAGFTKKYPHIKVEQEVVTNDPSAVLKSRIATNEIPDIFSAGIEVLDIARGGYMAELTNEPFLDRINESSVKSLSFTDKDGKTWAMPIDGSSIGVFYNKKLFSDNGISVPRTLDELKQTVETFKSKNIPAFALGFKEGWTIKMAIISTFSPAVYGQNLNWDADKYSGEVSFERSEGWKTAFETLNLIYEYGNQKTAFDTDYNGAVTMFAKGEAAMMAQGLWALEPIRQIAPDLDIGMMAMPVSDDPKDAKLHVFPDFSLSISAKSDHIEESKLFLDFMANPEIAEQWSNKARLFSAVKGVSTQFDPLAKDVETLIAEGQTVSQSDRGWPTPFHPEFEKVISEYLLGQKTLDESLKQLDSAWSNAVKAAN